MQWTGLKQQENVDRPRKKTNGLKSDGQDEQGQIRQAE